MSSKGTHFLHSLQWCQFVTQTLVFLMHWQVSQRRIPGVKIKFSPVCLRYLDWNTSVSSVLLSSCLLSTSASTALVVASTLIYQKTRRTQSNTPKQRKNQNTELRVLFSFDTQVKSWPMCLRFSIELAIVVLCCKILEVLSGVLVVSSDCSVVVLYMLGR